MSDMIDFKSPLPVDKKISPANDFTVPPVNIELWENATDFFGIGRESIPFINRPSMIGRESLLITDHRSSPFDRFKWSEMEFDGRESLGLLNLNDLSGAISPFCDRVSISSGSFLDKAFLLHPEHVDRRLSALSSLSSIHSLDSPKINSDSNLNRAFFDSSIKMRSQSIVEEVSEEVTRHRISSVPIDIVKDMLDLQFDSAQDCKAEEEMPIEEDDPNFNDSVFIEANCVASNIANGSYFDESFEGNGLDDTAPPDFDNLDKSDGSPITKCDEQSVFKKLDKLIPPTMDEPIRQDNSVNKSANNNTTTTSSTGDKSHKDARELLQNLSEIISVECKNNEQKRRSQSLLSDLADILIVQREASLSGKENTPLRTSKSASDVALDLSVKSHGERRLSQSYTSMSTTNTPPLVCNLKKQSDAMKALALGTERISASSNPSDSKGSVSSVKSESDFKIRLKHRKSDDNIIRRGPLKIINPGNVRNKILEGKICKPPKTPPKRMIKTCTSTPIYESKGKFAQSTPENKKSAPASPLKKFTCGLSPLKYPTPVVNNKGKSGSLQNLSKIRPAPIDRRHTLTDLKPKDCRLPLKRTSSIDKTDKKTSVIPPRRSSSIDKIDKKPPVIPLKRTSSIGKIDKKAVTVPLKRTNSVNSNDKKSAAVAGKAVMVRNA